MKTRIAIIVCALFILSSCPLFYPIANQVEKTDNENTALDPSKNKTEKSDDNKNASDSTGEKLNGETKTEESEGSTTGGSDYQESEGETEKSESTNPSQTEPDPAEQNQTTPTEPDEETELGEATDPNQSEQNPPSPNDPDPTPTTPDPVTPPSEQKGELLANGNYRIFSPSVSLKHYYDVNKKWDGSDTDLCWAATSSNMISWWQEQYSTLGKTLPLAAINGEEAIFKEFKKYNAPNSSGTFLNGVPWYFIGDQSGRGGAYGGFLTSICGREWNPFMPTAYTDYSEKTINTIEKISSVLLKDMAKGIGGLKLHNIYDHAITLCGIEYNASNTVVAIYVTDSDDYKSAVMRYEIYFDGSDVVMKGYDSDYNKIRGIMLLYAPK